MALVVIVAENLEELLDEYGIDYITTGKNTSKNYVNISGVPICSCEWDTNYTHGIHRSLNRSYCWYCAQFYTPYQIAKGLGIPFSEWKATMNNVADEWGLDKEELAEEIDPDELQDIEIPGDPLHQVHKNYLISRGFDPDWLVEHYNIKGTLKHNKDFKLSYRVIFPITYEDKYISYIGRSYVETMNKYICCEPENESAFHKNLLFNMDKAHNKRVIVVEGALDALKLIQSSGNFNIVATYGTSIKPNQLRLLRTYYQEVIVLFDPEEGAQAVSDKIVTYLQSFGVKAVGLKLKTGDDPGALSKEDAKYLVNYLLSDNFPLT